MCNAGPPPYYAVFLISAQSTKAASLHTLDFPSVFDLDIDIVNARCSNSSRASVSKCKRILFHRVDRGNPPYPRLPHGVLSVAFRSLVRTSKQEFASTEAATTARRRDAVSLTLKCTTRDVV
ncbi:hypothetical protein NEUTE1DRAFT_147789 [Neurospora tetrasperma FGSC 2508]|uniref:Uncharacterized protein n=1 Tax=Neurospora tetrasperma (strain FGSC 2508 / ATCC MYA-4615 / P0657) TaxID=510951 RepID=F8MT79_NEUT8|nr:uncharacterized protein NEUTE1DRAFT_147789 [Neurospora tetrasperma FGSC 2508]EGO55211.1 hypothetical protein NEUTE1DRAFT_147789 [Neurospora tetrasperma FGSC 2508]EGZ69573.1 hypothetical protein NEUTE2DRAFT_169170 [Neurospora tetrasperma FGSC 2509]